MKPQDDFGDLLVEEVLTELADTFFGARVELEKMIEIFYDNLQELTEIGNSVLMKAGFLNFLFAEEKVSCDFFETLGVKNPEPFLRGQLGETALPSKVPFALSVKGEFTKLVSWGYEQLHQACKQYVRGAPADDSKNSGNETINPGYNLIRNMCDLINREVKKVNEMSPNCVLQFSRKFNTDQLEKEKVTGSGYSSFGHQGLDQKMCFKPIPFNSLPVINFPELPPPPQVESAISAFCRQKYPMHKYLFQKRVEEIKDKVRRKA